MAGFSARSTGGRSASLGSSIAGRDSSDSESLLHVLGPTPSRPVRPVPTPLGVAEAISSGAPPPDAERRQDWSSSAGPRGLSACFSDATRQTYYRRGLSARRAPQDTTKFEVFEDPAEVRGLETRDTTKFEVFEDPAEGAPLPDEERREDWSSSESPRGRSAFLSDADQRGYYRRGPPGQRARRGAVVFPEVFEDVPEVPSYIGSSPRKKAGVGIARPVLADISNLGRAGPAASRPERKAAAKSPVRLPDANPQLVGEYAPDVMRSMLQSELGFMPNPEYMGEQPQINAKMRAILNDWLFEVHRKYALKRETLFLAVNLTDRHLSHATVSRHRLQLVGVTGLWIAAKFEEVDPPELEDLVYVTADSYTKQDIMEMEVEMLAVLGFQVAAPTAADFLRHFQAAPQIQAEISGCAAPAQAEGPLDQARADVAWYLMELALLDIRMIRHAPSHVAAAAVLLSNKLSGIRPAWPSLLSRLSGYVEKELEACAAELAQLLEAAPQSALKAVRSKYRHLDLLYKHPVNALQSAARQ